MPRRKIDPATTEKLIQVENALENAVISGATPDQIIKKLLENESILGAIVKTHIRAAMAGNVQSAAWLFARGFGTPSQTIKHEGGIDLKAIWGDPLDSSDDLYLEEGEEQKALESGE